MNIITIILLSIGLASDALVIVVCNGISNPSISKIKQLQMSITFGVVQASILLLGFLIGNFLFDGFRRYLSFLSITIILILAIKMFFTKAKDDSKIKDLTLKIILIQAIATSVDNFAAGIIFSDDYMSYDVFFLNITVVAVITFVVCFVGLIFSKYIGVFLKDNATRLGAVLLLLVAIILFWRNV